MAPFKGTPAEKELQRLVLEGKITATTTPKVAKELSELFKPYSEDGFKSAFYRYTKDIRVAAERARNAGRKTPPCKFSTARLNFFITSTHTNPAFLQPGTDGRNAGASIVGMEVPAAVSTASTAATSVFGGGTAAAPLDLSEDTPSTRTSRRLNYEDPNAAVLTFQPPVITSSVRYNNQLVQYAVVLLPTGTVENGGLRYFVNPDDLQELVIEVQMPELMGSARTIHRDLLGSTSPEEQKNHIRVAEFSEALRRMRPSAHDKPWFTATIALPYECLTTNFARHRLWRGNDGSKLLCLDMVVEDGTIAKKLGVETVEVLEDSDMDE